MPLSSVIYTVKHDVNLRPLIWSLIAIAQLPEEKMISLTQLEALEVVVVLIHLDLDSC